MTFKQYLLDEWVGWASPTGKKIYLNGQTHDDVALKILNTSYPSWQNKKWHNIEWRYPTDALEFQGWVRVVGPGGYEIWNTDFAYDALSELLTGAPRNQSVNLFTKTQGILDITPDEFSLKYA